jgi:cytidylate kinase
MKNTNIIAIDGPASSGKGTIAKKLAQNLKYVYLDTGAMYRALTYYCLENNLDMKSELVVYEALQKIELAFLPAGTILLNQKDVSKEIRSNDVSFYTSNLVSTYPSVRELMVKKQQQYGEATNIVVDGRDIATVVFPNANIKLFISASLHVRTLRRIEQNKKMGINDTYEYIKNELALRDFQDTTRPASPLVIATNAIVVDSSNQSVEETLQTILDIVKRQEERELICCQ